MADFGVGEAAALVISAVGTGVSMYNQQQQAQTSDAVAKYNEAAAEQNATLQAKLAEQQQTWNQQSALAQYQTQQNNATALDQQAQATQAQGRVQAQQMRDGNQRTLATLRTKYAGDGVTMECTPLAVLAGTAGQLESQVQDADYQTGLQADDDERQADSLRQQSQSSLMDANVAQYQSALAQTDQQIAINKASDDYAISQAGSNSSAPFGTLLSGAAQIARAIR